MECGYLSGTQDYVESREIMQGLTRDPPAVKILFVTPEKVARSDYLMRTLDSLHARCQLARPLPPASPCGFLCIQGRRLPRAPWPACTPAASWRVPCLLQPHCRPVCIPEHEGSAPADLKFIARNGLPHARIALLAQLLPADASMSPSPHLSRAGSQCVAQSQRMGGHLPCWTGQPSHRQGQSDTVACTGLAKQIDKLLGFCAGPHSCGRGSLCKPVGCASAISCPFHVLSSQTHQHALLDWKHC